MTAVRHTLGALTSAYLVVIAPIKVPIKSAGSQWILANKIHHRHKLVVTILSWSSGEYPDQ